MDVDVMAEQVRIPLACSEDVQDLTAMTRLSCGLETEYRWQIGGENDYTVRLNAEGEPVYVAAFGYVSSLCDLSAEAHAGDVSGGVRSEETCGEECHFCDPAPGGGETPMPNCDCVFDPENSNIALQPLDEFCEKFGCATTIEQAREHLTGICTSPDHSRIVTGCGFVSVEWGNVFGRSAYYFDEESGALVGALVMSDIGFGRCLTPGYRGGIAPPASCDTEITSNCCIGGEAGAGGANDGVVVCTP